MADLLTILPETTPAELGDEIMGELKDHAFTIADGWYADGRIDWENVFDRMDDSEMLDGRRLEMTTLYGPVIDAIKAHVRKVRRES